MEAEVEPPLRAGRNVLVHLEPEKIAAIGDDRPLVGQLSLARAASPALAVRVVAVHNVHRMESKSFGHPQARYMGLSDTGTVQV